MFESSKNKLFQRFLMEDLKKYIDRREIFAIKGPRQSGKTTILKMLRDFLIEEKAVNPDNIIFITFEDREILEKFSEDAKRYIQSFILDASKKYYFLIDEFQYLNDGGQKLKLLYDLFENTKFIVTGSSSLELKSQTGKFLVGRIFSFNLMPLSFAEFLKGLDERIFKVWEEQNKLIKNFISNGKVFARQADIFISDINKYYIEYLIWGGYPAVAASRDNETKKVVLKNIFDTYITKDIIDFLRMENSFEFARFFKILAAQIGNLTNFDHLALEMKSYHKEIKRFFAILEETYIVSLLRPYYKNLTTELKKNPKIYFFDLGIRNYAISDFSDIGTRPDMGAVAENCVLNQLKINLSDDMKINFWRTLAKAEVDFILSAGTKVVPLEVKYSAFKEPKIEKSFRSFLASYNPERAVVATKDYWGEMEQDKTLIKFIPMAYL